MLPPWKQPKVEIDLSLTKFKKDETNNLVYHQEFLDLKEKYCNFQEIYTDGSKHEEKTEAAVYCPSDPDKCCQVRLKDNTSVFNAELEGFLMALKTINTRAKKKFVIFTDSLSALQGMLSPVGANKGIQQIYKELERLKNCRLCFVWIPGHAGIKAMSVKRSNYLEWQEYFMSIAFLSAQRSKDPRTQVGACIVNKENKIVGIGYNGMPIGCDDNNMPWNRAEDDTKESWFNSKSPYVCHAELNAVLNKNQANIKDCTIYVALFPCNMCAQIIIQSGIKEVIYYSDKYHGRMEFAASRRLMDTAGITYRQFKPRQKKVIIEFDTIEKSLGQEPIQNSSSLGLDKSEDNLLHAVTKNDGSDMKSHAWSEMTNNNNIVKRKDAALFNHAEQQNLPANIGEDQFQNIQEALHPAETSSPHGILEVNFAIYSLIFIACLVGLTWLVANSNVLPMKK